MNSAHSGDLATAVSLPFISEVISRMDAVLVPLFFGSCAFYSTPFLLLLLLSLDDYLDR
jgi:hypothetical protein